MLFPWLLFPTRAPVVVLGSLSRLPMSSSWPVFPGLDQALFPSMVFLVFGIRFQSGAKEPTVFLVFRVFKVFRVFGVFRVFRVFRV